MIFAGKFFLPIVLRNNYTNEYVHEEEIADNQDHQEKKSGNSLKISIVVWGQVIAPRFWRLMHDFTPRDWIWNDEQVAHRLNDVIKIEIRILPFKA